MKLIEMPVNNIIGLQAGLKELARSKNIPDVIFTIADPICVMPDSYITIAKFADEHKIPVTGGYVSLGNYGSIFVYIPESVPQGKQAAFLADKILKGTPAGTIPVISAESYLKINYKIAKKLGIKFTEGLLSRANEVIR